MSYLIERNSQTFGPYDISTLHNYVEDGKILLQDKVVDGNGKIYSVRQVLKTNGKKIKIRHSGNIINQLKSFGLGLILPKTSFSLSVIRQDKNLLLLAIIGLAPAILMVLTGFGIVTFYAVALYFSLIWGLFYYSIFRTVQVQIKKTILIFFTVQLLIFVLVELFRIPSIHPLYGLINQPNLFLKLTGFIFGVGLFEEFVKVIAVYIFIRRSSEPLVPQTVVFYGLISGIGFGVFEGVVYQVTVNAQLDYSSSFFMNIARLTSLPFLHSIWAGISSYFLAFTFLYPTQRISLWILSLVIPSLLHGFYNTLGWSIFGFFISYLGLVLLLMYLNNAKNFQRKILK
jgi:RsiW-degrading membrane proteinase PrsW (M82 family)